MPNFKGQIAKRVKSLAGLGQGSFQASITSSNIKTATKINLSNNAVGGPIYIDNIIIETDATGLAGGTNFQILRSGSIGLSAFMVHAVSSLGANASIDLNSATTKQRIVLFPGEQLQVNCTSSNCTGPGKIYVTVIFKKIADGADLTPAIQAD